MKAKVHIGLVVDVDKFLASATDDLSNGSGSPGWIVELYFGIGDQVTVLLEVVRDTDQFIMSFDHEAVKVRHVEAHMEVTLGLELLQEIMGLQ